MKQLLKLFIPIIWLMVSIYFITILLEFMNQKDTFIMSLSFIGILLIGYLSFKLQLGSKLLKTKNKENED
jgi:hypothetical protein